VVKFIAIVYKGIGRYDSSEVVGKKHFEEEKLISSQLFH
jgi:hypothetical protein